MAALLPWIKRRWSFDFPVELFPDILERLQGTAARLEDMLRGTKTEMLTRREKEGTWSIQENVGHLISVEELHAARLDQFLAGETALRPADMSNRRTDEADYNARPVAALLSEFRLQRDGFIEQVQGLAVSDFARTAHHPRLDQPMRLVDMCLFMADHDDYHLARIRELLRLWQR